MHRILSRTRSAVMISAITMLSLAAAGCGNDNSAGAPSDPATETYAASLGVNISQMTQKTTGLYVKDVVVGTGTEAIAGKQLTVIYSGYLTNATLFDSNVGRTAFTFTMGAGQVIRGWDLGFGGMRVGGKRKIVIGSALGYGSAGSGTIPANATLVFDVELTNVQ